MPNLRYKRESDGSLSIRPPQNDLTNNYGDFYAHNVPNAFMFNKNGVYDHQTGKSAGRRWHFDGHEMKDNGQTLAYRFDGFHFVELTGGDFGQMRQLDYMVRSRYYQPDNRIHEHLIAMWSDDLWYLFEGRPTYDKYLKHFKFLGYGVKEFETGSHKTYYGFSVPMVYKFRYQAFQYKDKFFLYIKKGIYNELATLFEFSTMAELFIIIDNPNVLPIQSIIVERIDNTVSNLNHQPLYMTLDKYKPHNLVDKDNSVYSTYMQGDIIDGSLFSNFGNYSIRNIAYYPLSWLKMDDNQQFRIVKVGGSMSYYSALWYDGKPVTKYIPKERPCLVCDLKERDMDEFSRYDIIRKLLFYSLNQWLLDNQCHYFEGEHVERTKKDDTIREYQFNGKPVRTCWSHNKGKLIEVFNDNFTTFHEIIKRDVTEWRKLAFYIRTHKEIPMMDNISRDTYYLMVNAIQKIME